MLLQFDIYDCYFVVCFDLWAADSRDWSELVMVYLAATV